jgi:hypothetical protein
MSQKREDLIGSMQRCKEYFGGVTQAIVSDNLKSAVSRASKYEPIIGDCATLDHFISWRCDQ